MSSRQPVAASQRGRGGARHARAAAAVLAQLSHELVARGPSGAWKAACQSPAIGVARAGDTPTASIARFL